MRRNIALLLLSASFCASYGQKIDFNLTGRSEAEGTETGYTPWAVPKAKVATLSVGDGISLQLSCGTESNRTLKSNWWKQAVTSQGSKLVGDCVAVYGLDSQDNTPNLTDVSSTITLTVNGLAAGEHSVLAYHNVTDGFTGEAAPISISINGEVVQQDVMQTIRELLPSESGQSYVKFSVADGESVKITYSTMVEEGKTYTTSCVYINALVFDQPNPKATALNPYPANGDLHADGDNGTIELSWDKAESAVKNHLYVGLSAEDMKLVSSSAESKYVLKDVYSMNTYYWRVDQEDANGKIYKGEQWTFRPRRLAFPGAEGYGRFATGGKGGSVYHVTSLDDDVNNPQPGTLRYGITKVKGPRTIVFDVSGIIQLKGRLTCSDKFVTVAGQTAPGKGILLKGAPFGTASEGITRFIRNRLGYHNGDTNKGLDGLGMAGNDHSIVDHCSVGWTIDEAFSSRNAKNITLQHTLISEALNIADHPNYESGKAHGFAATIGGDVGTYHHNLLAHCEGRNWSLGGGLDGSGAYAGRSDIFNNIVYNWGTRATDGGTHECNFVGNYYKMGAGTSQDKRLILKAQLEGTGSGSQSYYVSGNIRENRDGTLTSDKRGDTYDYTTDNGQVVNWTVFVSQPFFPSYANVESAQLAFKTVLSDVGCNQPFFDEHDVRMVDETLKGTTSTKGCKSGKSGLIDRETDAEGFDYFPAVEETRPADYDTDGDGMPDWWEEATGHNPNVADNNEDDDRDGYTALEDYLNWIASPHYEAIIGATTEIDLKKLFAGFNNNPEFSINEAAGVTTSIKNGILAITPQASAAKLITLAVTANDSDEQGSMTRSVNLYVKKGTTAITSPVSMSDKNATYNIFSADGKLIKTGNDIENLSKGIYILKATSNGCTQSFKVIKK